MPDATPSTGFRSPLSNGPYLKDWKAPNEELSYDKILVHTIPHSFMTLSVYPDYESLSHHASDAIVEQVSRKPDTTLCLASGDTPRLTCRLTAEKAARVKTDFSRCTFIGLDEWVGIPPENEGSCRHFFETEVFAPLSITRDRIHLFDGMSIDLENECRVMDASISQKGGIDLMVVGIGMNGHIGFNEPGISFDLYAHVVDLDEATRTVGQKYFRQKTELSKGITLGLKHLMEARRVILIANGARKAEVIRKALEEETTTTLPASIIRKHPNAHVMLDEGAASGLAASKI